MTKSKFGIKSDSVLNELQYFHVTRGLGPDICHDLLEGIVPHDLAFCINKLIADKYFTLEELNNKFNIFQTSTTIWSIGHTK